MAFTYNTSLANLSDHIRAALGDTDSSNPILQDETVNAKLGAFGYLEALAQCAEACIGLFGQYPTNYNQGAGGEMLAWADRIRSWGSIRDAARGGRIMVPTLPFVRQGAGVGQIASGLQTDSTVKPATGTGPDMTQFRAD